jgi:hypothetical protein
MDRTEASRILEESLGRRTATPCTSRRDRDVYIEEQKASLRACLIAPLDVSAVASAWAQEWCSQPDTIRQMIAFARREGSWLLYDPSAKTFALAYGDNPADGPLSLHGFESDDALAEWLG